jgi:hypothetical protein
MPGTTLDPADAAELAETLTFLTQWLSGSHKQTLADSFRRLRRPSRLQHRHPLRRPAPVRLPSREQRRRRTLRRANIMTGRMHHPLDKITLPNRRAAPSQRLLWAQSTDPPVRGLAEMSPGTSPCRDAAPHRLPFRLPPAECQG